MVHLQASTKRFEEGLRKARRAIEKFRKQSKNTKRERCNGRRR